MSFSSKALGLLVGGVRREIAKILGDEWNKHQPAIDAAIDREVKKLLEDLAGDTEIPASPLKPAVNRGGLYQRGVKSAKEGELEVDRCMRIYAWLIAVFVAAACVPTMPVNKLGDVLMGGTLSSFDTGGLVLWTYEIVLLDGRALKIEHVASVQVSNFVPGDKFLNYRYVFFYDVHGRELAKLNSRHLVAYRSWKVKEE